MSIKDASPAEVHDPSDQMLDFYGVPLRAAGIVELMAAQRDNTFLQQMQCARLYKERALRALYPARKNLGSLDPEGRRRVANYAIRQVLEDSCSGRSIFLEPHSSDGDEVP